VESGEAEALEDSVDLTDSCEGFLGSAALVIDVKIELLGRGEGEGGFVAT